MLGTAAHSHAIVHRRHISKECVVLWIEVAQSLVTYDVTVLYIALFASRVLVACGDFWERFDWFSRL